MHADTYFLSVLHMVMRNVLRQKYCVNVTFYYLRFKFEKIKVRYKIVCSFYYHARLYFFPFGSTNGNAECFETKCFFKLPLVENDAPHSVHLNFVTRFVWQPN